ncbi:MAG: hypothetical protein KGI98_02955 [Euryarchaeota archaeon]|nr:hypothetical protein [Euryarchaeota archaeon]MDE1879555.1 hypothetical protein [Euryarchaeota archaeon]
MVPSKTPSKARKPSSSKPAKKMPAAKAKPKSKPKAVAKAKSKPAAKPPSGKPPVKLVASAPPPVQVSLPIQILLGDEPARILSLQFVRDGDEFLARLESAGGHITELKNRSLDQLLTMVAGELEDLLG